MKPKLFFLLLVVALVSCRKETPHAVDFYYWKTKVAFNETERDYFRNLQARKLYIRFFDVDKDGRTPVPQAIISSFNAQELVAEYVPTVFITNRTFAGLSESETDTLAGKVFLLAQQIADSCRIRQFGELQVDCDWTKSTRAAYFRFLDRLKVVSGKRVSCTLRLHQIKYRLQTGVPPVDKGYLMCYATSDPKTKDGKNSILDLNLLKDYLADIEDYPLSFDVALPLHSWGIVRNHRGAIKLVNGATANEFHTDKFRSISATSYQTTDDFFFHGLYLNKGFVVDLEEITPELLAEAKIFLSKKLRNRPYHIVYFHLDSIFVKRFTFKELL